MTEAGLSVLGLIIGCVGTLIGAGGGFVLAPILLLLYPALEPEQLSAVSLAIVCVNATVGSFVYWLKGNVDVRSGLTFALAAIPAAICGVYLNTILPRVVFATLIGVLLICGSVWLLIKPLPRDHVDGHAAAPAHPTAPGRREPLGPSVPHDRRAGLALAAGIGLISSLLGIGGGVIHVPAMVHLLRFPVHNATATSHFVLALTAATAVAIHLSMGSYAGHWHETTWLALGVVAGSPIGAALSSRLHGAAIIRALAIALGLVGVRVIWSVL